MEISAQNGYPLRSVHAQRDAFGAPPGTAPFHRVLEAQRLARRGHDTFELASARRVDPSDTSNDSECARGRMAEPLLPSLGDLTPLPEATRTGVTETVVRPRVVGATGRVLDLYA